MGVWIVNGGVGVKAMLWLRNNYWKQEEEEAVVVEKLEECPEDGMVLLSKYAHIKGKALAGSVSCSQVLHLARLD